MYWVHAQVSPEGFVMNKLTLGQVFLHVVWFSPVNITILLIHIHSYIIWGMANGLPSGSSPKVSLHCNNNNQSSACMSV
jgi:hypothetical protein